MAYLKFTGGAALIALLLGSTAAHADVTADEVWQSWVDYYGSFGATITTGSKGMDGDTLIVSNAVFASATPTGNFSATLPEVRMKELGDGRVEITLPAAMPIVVNGKDAAGKTTDIAMSVNQTGMTTIASGVAGDMTYDFAAPEVSIKLDGVKADGKDIPVNLAIVTTGGSGKYHIVKQAGTAITQEFKADKVTFDVAGADPATPDDKFTMTGALNALAGTGDMTVPDGVDMANMSAALNAGMALKANMTFGQGDYTFEMTGAQAATGTVSGGSGSINMDMSKDGLTYGVTGTAAKVSLAGAQIPFPVELGYGETAFNLTMPVTKSDTAQPFALLLKVVDLTVSDGIWGMIDPTAQLPHDPATVVVDVSGAAKMLMDIFDPANAEAAAAAGATPGQVESVNVNALQVKAVGAELTGTGAATFDNSGPVPKPVGAVDLKLVGANALIDKLVAMGLIPQDQAAGAKMMMGMFAVPAGEDTLTSKIEFKEDGGIYANGQRLQ